MADPNIPREFVDAGNAYDVLCNVLGMPADSIATSEELGRHVLATCMTEFSDGEFSVEPPDIRDPVLREWFAGQMLECKFMQGLRRLRVDESPDARALTHEIAMHTGRVVGYATANQSDWFADASDINQSTLVAGDMITFSDLWTHTLDRPAQTVMHFGPSIQGRYYVDTQVAALRNEQQPYLYLPMAKGPFVPAFLDVYYRERLRLDGVDARYYDDPTQKAAIVQSSEDGLVAATNDLIAERQQQGLPVEHVDATVCSGLHSAGVEAMEQGLANAHRLLRTGGVLLLASMVKPPGVQDANSRQMLECAASAGFPVARSPVVRFINKNDEGTKAWFYTFLTKE